MRREAGGSARAHFRKRTEADITKRREKAIKAKRAASRAEHFGITRPVDKFEEYFSFHDEPRRYFAVHFSLTFTPSHFAAMMRSARMVDDTGQRRDFTVTTRMLDQSIATISRDL